MARMKRNTKRTIGISVALVVVMLAAFAAFYMISTKQIKAVYEEELNVAQTALSENTKQVYCASRDIKLGETITSSDVTTVSAIVSIDSSQFFSAADIGSIALVDIPADTIIASSMITYESYEDTLRETEFDVLVLNSNLTDGDFIDVRIRYQNGEDYVVLTKKCAKNISLRNAICYMDLNEEETQLISSAIVDASLHGAILYTNTYLEPAIQPASVVTYQPSKDTLRLIYDNPNIIEIAAKGLSAVAREEMEKRLAEYEEMLHDDGRSSNEVSNVEEVPVIEDAGNMQDTYVETDSTAAE